jgi:phosphate transport system substrate-binding protein
MKKMNWPLIAVLMVIVFGALYLDPFRSKISHTGKRANENTIAMSGAWALYPMAIRWGEEYTRIHPEVRFDITAGGAGKGMTDVLSGNVDIGKVSREIHKDEVAKGAFYVAVVKDAVVPVMNANNPAAAEVQKRGIKQNEFKKIWITGTIKDWSCFSGTKTQTKLSVYTRSDSCGAAATWAEYLGKKQEDLKGVGIFGDPGIAQAVRSDVSGIGYNNLNFAFDKKTKLPIKGLLMVPIDINGNGKIDKKESFYATRDELMAAIATGRYPSPPAKDLYFVTKGKPKAHVKAFIEWALTDGQKYVNDSGYICLSKEKLSYNLEKLK